MMEAEIDILILKEEFKDSEFSSNRLHGHSGLHPLSRAITRILGIATENINIGSLFLSIILPEEKIEVTYRITHEKCLEIYDMIIGEREPQDITIHMSRRDWMQKNLE